MPIPAVDFTEPAPSIAKIFNQENRIYATPDEFFVTKFRDIFQQTRLRHTASAEAKTWLRGPNIKYWPQQLNFATFCATQGCGISREIFVEGLTLSPQIRAFYQFHVYLTIRRVLYQLGGIQSMSALPGDPTFNPFNNHYDVASYKRISAEFGIDPSSDFRFTMGENHGLGRVNGEMQLDFEYPGWRCEQRKQDFLYPPRPNCLNSVQLVCAKKIRRFDTSGPFTNQPANRSIRLLHLGRTS